MYVAGVIVRVCPLLKFCTFFIMILESLSYIFGVGLPSVLSVSNSRISMVWPAHSDRSTFSIESPRKYLPHEIFYCLHVSFLNGRENLFYSSIPSLCKHTFCKPF